MKVRTLGGILALALGLAGCASGVDGAGVVGNESNRPAGAATASGGVPLPPSKAQFGGRDNLVPNGSFEHGTWPWVPFTGSKELALTRSHKFGKVALLVRPMTKGPTVGAAIVDLVSRPASGSRYSFSAWVKGARGGPRALAGVELAVLESGKSRWRQIGAEGRPVTGSWQHLSARGTVRARNAAYLRVTVSLNDISPGAWLAIDGVEAKILKSGSRPSVGS